MRKTAEHRKEEEEEEEEKEVVVEKEESVEVVVMVVIVQSLPWYGSITWGKFSIYTSVSESFKGSHHFFVSGNESVVEHRSFVIIRSKSLYP